MRGALLISISIYHPDVEDFIDAKTEKGVTGANISVKNCDEFMKCVLDNKPFLLRFPIDAKFEISENEFQEMKYDKLIKKDGGVYIKKVDAKKIWDKLIRNNYNHAEPGVLFFDTIIKESLPDCYRDFGFKTISVNPCGRVN